MHAVAHAIHTLALIVGYASLTTGCAVFAMIARVAWRDSRDQRAERRRRENAQRMDRRFAEIRAEQD